MPIRRYPIATYFAATYALSWGGALLLAAPKLARGVALTRTDGLLMFPVMLVGPSLAGIACTALVDGKSGLRALFARLRRWRVGAWWYAAALLIPPTLILAVLLALSALVSPVFAPNRYWVGLSFGLSAGVFEEIGWTGYAFPKLRARYGALPGSLLLGVLWGLWHAPVIDYLGAASPHGAYWLPFFLAFVAAMTALRVLIGWIVANTGSVPLAMLMHASSTGALAMLSPAPIAPAQEALWYATYAAALWAVVALVAATYGRRLVRSRPSLQPLVAAEAR
jgi:uncharacterized protein